MNAYDFLIAGVSGSTRQGDMAIGHLLAGLRSSPHAAAMTAAGPWPTGWRQHGAAVITPDRTMLVLARDDRGVGVRGAEFAFDIIRIGSRTDGVESDAPFMLVEAGVQPLRAAIWAALEECGTEADRTDRVALL